MPDVTAVTQRDTDRVAAGAPTVSLVVHAAGSPCPGLCAWNPFRHGRQEALSEELYLEVRRTSKLLEVAFPGAAVEELEENVGSMMNETRDGMSMHAGYEPLEIQLSDLVEQRRRRYYWCSWKVRARPGVELVERPGCTRVRLLPTSRAPTSSWIRPGWRPSKGFEAFPTLTRPCPVSTPRWKTPGVARASPFALEQWRADWHRRPPIHYERRFQLICEKTGRRRYKDVRENEKLHGFAEDHTLPAFTAKERRADPVGALDERGKLLGNAYHPWAIAFLLGELAAEMGMIERGVDIDELLTQRIRLVPTPGNSLLTEVDEAWEGGPGDLKLQDMVRLLLLQQSARGGEIRNLQGVPRRGCAWQEIPASWFQWKTVLSVPWREPGCHINVCEARARDLAVRLRAWHRALHHQRYLHDGLAGQPERGGKGPKRILEAHARPAAFGGDPAGGQPSGHQRVRRHEVQSGGQGIEESSRLAAASPPTGDSPHY